MASLALHTKLYIGINILILDHHNQKGTTVISFIDEETEG